MIKKRIAALIEDARGKGLLPAEAEVRAAGICQTTFSPYWFLLIAPVFLLLVARQRLVLATDTDLYVFKINFWKAKQVDELSLTKPLAEADVKASGYSFKVEGGETLYPMLFQGGPLKEIAELAGAGEPASQT